VGEYALEKSVQRVYNSEMTQHKHQFCLIMWRIANQKKPKTKLIKVTI